MAQNDQERGNQGNPSILKKPKGQPHREGCLENIKKGYGEGIAPALEPENVRRADALAAKVANIFFFAQPEKKIAEGQGAEAISQEKKDNLHPSEHSIKTIYSAPDGRSRL